jgi:hypothetical protein
MSDTVLPPYQSDTDPSYLTRGGTYHPSAYHSNDQANIPGCQIGGKRRKTRSKRATRGKKTKCCKKAKCCKKSRYTGKRKTQNKRCVR